MSLDAEDRKILGEIATHSVRAAVEGREFVPPDPGRPALLEERGCFVTLKTDGQLRGCIGCFSSDKPLFLTVAEYARHSTLDDPRFVGSRLAIADLPRLDIEISALTPLAPCTDPEGIVIGRDGVYVRRGGRTGCFLPQVATEMGWNAEEFWGYCCRDKAGLEWDAWRQPGTTLMTFQAEAFGAGH